MIAWMQKRKKYLVVTIWISTIAFVGAGFVGWGSFDFGNTSRNSVAIVGKNAVSNTQFQQAFNNAFNNILQSRGGNFSQEDAEKLGLDRIILSDLIQKRLLLNYAQDLGIRVSDAEVVEVLTQDQTFWINGTFNKTQYEALLRNARLTPKDYESSIREGLQIGKLTSMLGVAALNKDVDAVATSYLLKDDLRLQVVQPSNLPVNEGELKKFWEGKKDNFKSKTKFELSLFFIPVKQTNTSDEELLEFYNQNRGDYRDKEDKLLSFDEAKKLVENDYNFALVKKEALQEYVLVKKGGVNASQNIVIDESNSKFPAAVLTQVKNAQTGDVLRPFEDKDQFIIVRVDNIIPPVTLNFEEARDLVLRDFQTKQKNDYLAAESQKLLQNGFVGEKLSGVERDFTGKISNLTQQESEEFIAKLFITDQKRGVVFLENKSVVFEILKQETSSEAKWKQYSNALEIKTMQLKNEELMKDLLIALQRRYEVKIYYKGQYDN